MPIALIIALLLAILAPASAAIAQDQDQEMPEPVVELLQDLRNLQQSLMNGGGVKEGDLPLLRRFQSRIDTLIEQHPDQKALVAAGTQVSVWLKDDDGVDAGYGRLLDLAGDDEALAARLIDSWRGYHGRQRNPDRVRALYDDLLARRPDDPVVKKDFAQWLRQTGEFERALEILEPLELDPETDVRALVTLGEAQFATHRFAEAYETLGRIPESIVDRDPTLQTLVVRAADKRAAAETYVELWTEEQQIRSREAEADDLPRAAIETTRGTFTVELFEDQAPNTVANFISLAESAHYHGSKFYTVIPGSYVMGGDNSAGTAARSNPGYRIPDEVAREDARKHFTGSIGMVKGAQPDSAGSLFYIGLVPLPERNAGSTVFGRVIEGMDVVRQLEKDDEIRSVTITRKRDHEYEPQTLPLS